MSGFAGALSWRLLLRCPVMLSVCRVVILCRVCGRGRGRGLVCGRVGIRCSWDQRLALLALRETDKERLRQAASAFPCHTWWESLFVTGARMRRNAGID